MNPDTYRPSEPQDFSAERLDDSLFRFADLLSGRTWDRCEAHGVSMVRSVTELMGEGTEEDEEVTKRTKLSFKADKTGGIAGDVEYGVPRYVLSSTTDEDVYLEGLPANVRQETLEDIYEKGHPLRKVLKEFGNEPSEYAAVLDTMPLRRREKSKFVIADGGEVIRYTMTHRYAFEDVVFLSAGYASDTGSMDWQRLQRPDGFAVELRPVVLEYISQDEKTRENEIIRQAEGLDTELERYFFQESLTEMLRIKGEPSEDTVRQVLGMLAMISADMKHYKP